MSQVDVKPGQFTRALKKLKKKLEEDGFHEAIQRHKYFMTKRQRRRMKLNKAIHKAKKARQDGRNNK